ncbi:MAG: prepilin peptidase [DPANN group archaeon]|nr:prepilin peptidase [DPANN group archaeon]
MIEYLAIAIAVLGTAYFAKTDYLTGYLPDGPMHAMILSGIAFVPFVYSGIVLEVYALAAVVFAIGFGFYTLGNLGGGDVKLFTALALLLPFHQSFGNSISGLFGVQAQTLSYPFVISIFVLSGLLFMAVMPLMFFRKIMGKRKKVEKFELKTQRGVLLAALVVPLAMLWYQYISFAVVVFFPLVFAMFIMPFKSDFVKHIFAEKKLVSKLDDDDVLALEVIPQHVKNKLGLRWRKTFTTGEIKSLVRKAGKHGIKTIMVCENMPKFVPYIFTALLLNLVFGDLIVYVLFSAL